MKNIELPAHDASDAADIARQAGVELAMLLVIEQSLRIALQWTTRGRGNSHKLSTLRFHTWSFERHLTRVQMLADHGGYMHRITDAHPHLAGDVQTLRDERVTLHSELDGIILRLEQVSRDNPVEFAEVCARLGSFLDQLEVHGQKESALLQQTFTQEEGGSG